MMDLRVGRMEFEDNGPSESAGYFLTAGQDGNYEEVIEGEDHVEIYGPFLVGELA